METLTISKEKLLKAYQNADDSGKTILSDLHGEEVFLSKITDRVKTFQDACNFSHRSADSSALLDYNGDDKDMLAAQAMLKLTIIARALNQGWTPNWGNNNEYKYYPWFKSNPSGFGFSYYDYDHSGSFTFVGSRLCFHSRELAEYAGKQFSDIYNQLFTL